MRGKDKVEEKLKEKTEVGAIVPYAGYTEKDTSRSTLSSIWDISIQDIKKAMKFTFLKGRDSKTQTKVDV